MKRSLKAVIAWPRMMSARLRAQTGRAARFSGAFPSYDAARAALPEQLKKGYDNDAIADVSFEWMCERAAWDYPLLYWLKTLFPDGGKVLDAGGHLGTKYIAFSDVLNVDQYDWTVYDLPGIISAARAHQAQGKVPAAITFCDQIDGIVAADILIASGFLQYLDTPFVTFLSRLPQRPAHILINKLPLRSGEPVVTIERIGSAHVPYQIRADVAWHHEVTQAGYRIVDTWTIPELSHVIATHPSLGASESRGFLLARLDVDHES